MRILMPDLPGTTWNDNHRSLATDESALGLLLLTSHKVFLGAGGEELTWQVRKLRSERQKELKSLGNTGIRPEFPRFVLSV